MVLGQNSQNAAIAGGGNEMTRKKYIIPDNKLYHYSRNQIMLMFFVHNKFNPASLQKVCVCICFETFKMDVINTLNMFRTASLPFLFEYRLLCL